MCGRYTIVVTLEELMLHYLNYEPESRFHLPRYNVAPMQNVLAIIHDGEKNRLGELRWGLVPAWASDERMGSKMINARAETLMDKPSFKKLVGSKRAIIPADGFYEWKQLGDRKQPMRITMKSGELFSMAALFDTWSAPDGSRISTCTIITTSPNSLMQDIHNRMPAILKREDEAAWLDRGNHNIDQLLSLLAPYPADEMRAYPVPALVGNVRNDSKACIEEAAAL